MEPKAMIIVYVTVPNQQVADDLSAEILRLRLAACVNAIPQMVSRYWWKEKLECSNEWILLIKTLDHLYEDLCACIIQQHPYQIPCILKIPVSGGHPPFLAWINQETKAAPP